VKSEYIERLAMVIRQLHNCDRAWIKTEPVHEVFNGQTVGKGDTEAFSVTRHPKAMAVRVSLVKQIRGNK
jgi:hypothetical protein